MGLGWKCAHFLLLLLLSAAAFTRTPMAMGLHLQSGNASCMGWCHGLESPGRLLAVQAPLKGKYLGYNGLVPGRPAAMPARSGLSYNRGCKAIYGCRGPIV